MIKTKKTREEFVTDTNKRIAIRTQIKAFYYNVYLPTLKKFDGKVYNIRFIKALREQLTDENTWFVREWNNGHIDVEVMVNKFNYTDKEWMSIKCELKDGRISYDLTVNDKVGQAWLENFDKYTEELQKSVDNYDEYEATVKKIEELYAEWEKLPYHFRNNIYALKFI